MDEPGTWAAAMHRQKCCRLRLGISEALGAAIQRNHPPARCVIPYMGLGGKGSRVEVALTLLAKDFPLKIETIKTNKAPKPFSHEPQAIKVGNLLFLSQHLPCDEKGALISEGVRDPNFPYYGLTSCTQMRYMLKNVAAICEAAGTKLENIVRRACFHDTGERFAESMEVWASHFPDRKPCSTTLIIGGPLVVPAIRCLTSLPTFPTKRAILGERRAFPTARLELFAGALPPPGRTEEKTGNHIGKEAGMRRAEAVDIAKTDICDDMRIEWNVPIKMDDGLVLRADVFCPVATPSFSVTRPMQKD